MDQKKANTQELQNELAQIEKNGVQADSRKLKEDMCAQFADPREWIREYVVNACDANAKNCWITGIEEENTLTICVEDNGHGMDRQGILDFNTIYRSVKNCTADAAVGQFGVGKLSVAAIPGQCGFSMTTSNGNEGWRMTTGSILSDEPIVLEKIEPVPQQGSRFEITFKKEHPLQQELKMLADILKKYLKFKEIAVCICSENSFFHMINGLPWKPGEYSGFHEPFARHFLFTAGSEVFDAVLSLSEGGHEIYQHRVLITNRYNLFSHGLEGDDLIVPYLSVRLDSAGFELPIGRHCLRNEEILAPLAKKMRWEILPAFFESLLDWYEEEFFDTSQKYHKYIEEIACCLMKVSYSSFYPWNNMPLFVTKNHHRLSLAELQKSVGKTGKMYLEGDDNQGIDYSIFDAPVLANDQPAGGKEIIEKLFKDKIVNLGVDDVVFEAPKGSIKELGPRETHFADFLRFHPSVQQWEQRCDRNDENSGGIDSIYGVSVAKDLSQRAAKIADESQDAQEELKNLEWRVNYLVQRDGKTPSRTHLFMMKKDKIILNLFHPEVETLLILSEKTPALAGHWALAMCLAEEKKILPHLTPETREEIILIDAIAKSAESEEPAIKEKTVGLKDRFLRDFYRNI